MAEMIETNRLLYLQTLKTMLVVGEGRGEMLELVKFLLKLV
jgi:hypothetical protein